jgi:hypothetical protein
MDRPVTIMYECLPDAPALPHPSSGKERIRQKYYLPLKAREFVKIKLIGRDALLVLPKWLFDAIPGTKCFRLVEQPPIIKYVDSRIQRGEAWDEQLHAHCEQTEPTPVFELVPLSLEELNEMFGKELGRPLPTEPIPEVKQEPVSEVIDKPVVPSEGALSEKKLKSVEELFSTSVLKFISESSEIRELNWPLIKFLHEYESFIVIDDENKIHGIIDPSFIIIKDEHRRDQIMLFVNLELLSSSRYDAKFVPPIKQSDGTFVQHVLLIKPDISKKISAKKFFRLVEQPPAMLNYRGQFTFGIDKDTIDMYKERSLRVFELVPMSLEELNDIFGQKRGGKTKRRNKKNRKSRKK